MIPNVIHQAYPGRRFPSEFSENIKNYHDGTTHLSTINGEEEQWEHITLKPLCSIWLIDEIKVKSVRMLTKTKE